MAADTAYWREDVQRLVNVECPADWTPFYCFHNLPVSQDCIDCASRLAGEGQ